MLQQLREVYFYAVLSSRGRIGSLQVCSSYFCVYLIYMIEFNIDIMTTRLLTSCRPKYLNKK